MRVKKVFVVVVECEPNAQNIQDYIAEELDSTGEVLDPETVFEESLEDISIGHPSWLQEWIEDSKPNTVDIYDVKIKEII